MGRPKAKPDWWISALSAEECGEYEGALEMLTAHKGDTLQGQRRDYWFDIARIEARLKLHLEAVESVRKSLAEGYNPYAAYLGAFAALRGRFFIDAEEFSTQVIDSDHEKHLESALIIRAIARLQRRDWAGACADARRYSGPGLWFVGRMVGSQDVLNSAELRQSIL